MPEDGVLDLDLFGELLLLLYSGDMGEVEPVGDLIDSEDSDWIWEYFFGFMSFLLCFL